VAVLLPALVPFAGLVGRVVGAGADAVTLALSARTARLLGNTLLLIGLVSVTAASVGVAAAWLTERTTIAGRRVWRVLVALPLVIPSYVVALAFVSSFGPTGLI
jgi:iron(III) transport system permease protein